VDDDVDSQMMDSIQSFSQKASAAPTDPIVDNGGSSPMAVVRVPQEPVKDVGLECDCNIKVSVIGLENGFTSSWLTAVV
jgi:hypothetical protein